MQDVPMEIVSVPTLSLSSGPKIPVLGLGTYPLTDGESERVVEQALAIGYRLVDTAENYRNEVGVGRGLRAAGVDRSELFVTTKFNAKWHGEDLVARAFEGSAERLGVDYIDLLLIHWPNPEQNRYVDAWRGLIALREQGLVRAIGVSNFKPAHLQRLLDETGVAPDVNQIQLNPLVSREELRSFGARHGVVTESWSPIGKGGELLEHPAVTGIAERLVRTPAQVVLRWHVQLGLVAIPKTGNPRRLQENLNVFDFELEGADMRALTALDRGEDHAVDSDEFGH